NFSRILLCHAIQKRISRKRRKIETEQQAKLAGSLHRFLVSTAEITAGPSSAAPQETRNPDPVSVDIPVPALEAETVSSKDVYTQPNLPENIDQKVYTDIGYWPETMDETLKTELVRRGTEELQNKDAWFPRDSNGRSFSKDWFYIHLDNARQTLPLRGHSEDLNTDGNCGNFLETFKLLAKYDPVAKQHLHRVQRTDGYIVSYLFPQSQNEFISLLGDHIRTVIFQNIIKAKYFAIMFDSTPDISHTDQMSQVIRYVHIEDSGVHVTESFIDFIQLYGKSADVITKQICDKLQADGLKLEHCYVQGYDNAATMAGHISGVQKTYFGYESQSNVCAM
ncbi:Hypothetical predicted protein, partial [Pelobates cultripes]